MEGAALLDGPATAPLGVSVVICTYNGAKRLPQTLAHLRAQQVPEDLDWEVIVVDNASVDTTADVARACWRDEVCVPLRVVHEPRPGLNNARMRGLSEARCDVVTFVDDDNWVCTHWVATVSKVMSSSPRLGAMAGLIHPVCEVAPPPWFDRYKKWYAIFDESAINKFGDPPRKLCGAGLSIRREAWSRLVALGFCFHVSDRKGASLDAHGDIELTWCLRLAGWELAIDPSIALEHFLPASRLTWEYLRRLIRTNAASAVPLEAFYFLSEDAARGHLHWIRQRWWGHAIRAGFRVLFVFPILLAAGKSSSEGNQDVLEAELKLGRFCGLLKLRSKCCDAWEDYAAFCRAAQGEPNHGGRIGDLVAG